MQKLLTVVVPVYRVEAYINKCLDSLLVSPGLLEKLEVILVNDGTPDHSAEMSREYVKRYPEAFRQIDKKNGGHGSAWNVGVREATGRYLRFLDSDDWFTNLDRLLSDLETCEEDVIFHPYNRCYASGNRIVPVGTAVPPGAPVPLSSGMWGRLSDGFSCCNFWSTTYKTSILRPLDPLFAEKVMFDDYILTWAPLVYGRTCRAFDYPVYNYLLGRPGQSMDLAAKRKGARSYAKCFDQFEAVRARIPADSVPPDLLAAIDASIADYARFVFPFMKSLPFQDSRARMTHLWSHYVKDAPKKYKMEKRFGSLPFSLFYLLECFRSLLKRR